LIYFISGFYFFDLFKKKDFLLIVLSLVYVSGIAFLFGRKTDNGLEMIDFWFLVAGIAGSYLSIQFGLTPVQKQIKDSYTFFGKNTIIVYGTHRLIYTMIGKGIGYLDFTSTPLFIGLFILVLTMILEIPIIVLINRYFPILAGKKIVRKDSL